MEAVNDDVPQEGAAAAPSPGQAADLAALAQSIADSTAAPGAEADSLSVSPAAPTDHDDEAAMAVDMFVDMAIAYEPTVDKFWPQKTRKSVAVALAAVLKKYNFSLFASPELALIFLAAPPLYQTSRAIAAAINKPQDNADK